MWGAIIQALLGGYSMYEQYAARQDAKRAQKRQREQDAWDQLLSAAGGYQPGRQAQAEALPRTNYGATALGMYNAIEGQQGQQQQQETQNTLADRQQTEVERANLAREALTKQAQETRGVERKPLALHSPPKGELSAVEQLQQLDAFRDGKALPGRVDTGSGDLIVGINNLEELKAHGEATDADLATLAEMKKRLREGYGKSYSPKIDVSGVQLK